MSPEEKIEAAQKLIDEARVEFAAKKRNWLEEAKPGMLFRSNGKVVAIPPRHPVDHAISLDPERIGMSCYGWENDPDIEYLGHARDILTIALPPQVIEAHEPTGADVPIGAEWFSGRVTFYRGRWPKIQVWSQYQTEPLHWCESVGTHEQYLKPISEYARLAR